MIWQDVVLVIASIIMSYALVPQVYYGFKTKRKTITLQTALITTFSLFLASFVYFSLNLILSTITTVIAAILWLILLIQSIIYKK